jgi:hypothetical protein
VDIFPTIFDFLRVDGAFTTTLSGRSLLGTNAPLYALAVQHRGALPTGLVIDMGHQRLWVDLIGVKRTGSRLEASALAATALLDAMDEELRVPAHSKNKTPGAIPPEVRHALGQLIFLDTRNPLGASDGLYLSRKEKNNRL